MDDKKLDKWIKENPMKANAIFPSLVVLGAVTIQAFLIFLIDWFLYIHSF